MNKGLVANTRLPVKLPWQAPKLIVVDLIETATGVDAINENNSANNMAS